MTATYLRLIFAAIFWGGTFVAGRLVTREVDPYTAAFLRFLLASLVLSLLLHIQESGFPSINKRQLVALLLLGLTGIFGYNLLFFAGLKTVEAGRAALIVAANPVFIALFSFLLFRERFNLPKIIGILLSTLGVTIVISRGELQLLLRGEVGSGELLLLGCVFSWVAYTLIGKRVLQGLTPLAAVTYSSALGTLLLSVPLLIDGHYRQIAELSPGAYANLGYLALFGTVLGFVWFYNGVQKIGPTRAAQFINLVPLSGVGLGILLLGEQPSLSLLSGGALVIGGLVLTNRYSGVQ